MWAASIERAPAFVGPNQCDLAFLHLEGVRLSDLEIGVLADVDPVLGLLLTAARSL